MKPAVSGALPTSPAASRFPLDSPSIDVLLRICVSLTLFARGWLTWRWDSPVRELVWKEDWWSGWLLNFGTTWSDFAQNSDPVITSALEVMGVVLMLLATVPWIAKWPPLRKTIHLLWLGALLLALDAFSRWVAADFEFAMGIEHALQVVTPLALLATARRPIRERRWYLVVSVCTALTFIGHGLYAAGIYPVPLVFLTMTQNILHVGQETARTLLWSAGIIDLLAAAGLFFQITRRPALAYMILWGVATALARPLAHEASDPWIAESLVRSPHWMLPLVLFLVPRVATIRVESQ